MYNILTIKKKNNYLTFILYYFIYFQSGFNERKMINIKYFIHACKKIKLYIN